MTPILVLCGDGWHSGLTPCLMLTFLSSLQARTLWLPRFRKTTLQGKKRKRQLRLIRSSGQQARLVLGTGSRKFELRPGAVSDPSSSSSSSDEGSSSSSSDEGSSSDEEGPSAGK